MSDGDNLLKAIATAGGLDAFVHSITWYLQADRDA
jgi:hypothetical protein